MLYKFVYKVKEFLLFKGFNFIFNLYYNDFYLKFKNFFKKLKLPLLYFFKNEKKKKSFFFITRFLFRTFLIHLFNFYNKFYSLYFFTLKLKGLGYRIFQISKYLIKIFLNRSNFYYLHLPYETLLKYRTRFFFLISVNLVILRSITNALLYLKEFSIYRILGIFYKSQILLVKPGKNKYR